MTYLLINAELRAQEHPATFQIPSKEKREGLTDGHDAKLVFWEDGLPHGVNGERMWVEILVRLDVGYVGRLLNQPVFMRSIKRGDVVTFGPEHVADWDLKERRQ